MKDKELFEEGEPVEEERTIAGYSEAEAVKILKALKRGQPIKKKRYTIGQKNTRWGVISDTHWGNRVSDKGLYEHAVKEFKRRKVDFVTHVGDVCDGLYTNRPGHVYELEAIGADEQMNLAADLLSQIDQPIFMITGNHTRNTFHRNAGLEIGHSLERMVDGLHYIGNGEGDIELNRGVKLKLMHPDGGTAYAISYKSQKLVESFGGGEKPHILEIGHFHKAEYIFYRNIHVIQAATLCGQTPFMRGKQLPAHKGFWICTANIGKRGVAKFTPEFYPAYD